MVEEMAVRFQQGRLPIFGSGPVSVGCVHSELPNCLEVNRYPVKHLGAKKSAASPNHQCGYPAFEILG
jgi:hypothetical protein